MPETERAQPPGERGHLSPDDRTTLTALVRRLLEDKGKPSFGGKVSVTFSRASDPETLQQVAQVVGPMFLKNMRLTLDAVNAPRLVSNRASLLVHLDWIHSDIAGICFMRVIAYFFCGVLTGFFC